MSVIICKECKKEISEDVEQCPNCGFKVKDEPKKEIEMSMNDETKEEGFSCKKCGTLLKENQQFCPKCGTERGFTNNKKCPKCGEIIEPGEKFCSKCGAKSKLDFQSDIIDKTKKIKINKKNLIIIVAVVLFLVLGGTIASKVIPKLTISVDELLAEGNYEEAYKKAKGEEKTKVEYENLIAYICNDVSEGLKDPSSFKLREAWYDKSNQRIVLYVNGNNSYGAQVGGYWYYTYDEDDNKYELYTSLSSLEEEKTYSWDDSSEKLEKLLKNIARTTVKEIIRDDDLEISKNSVDNINKLFEKKLLDDVKLLDVNLSLGSSSGDKI